MENTPLLRRWGHTGEGFTPYGTSGRALDDMGFGEPVLETDSYFVSAAVARMPDQSPPTSPEVHASPGNVASSRARTLLAAMSPAKHGELQRYRRSTRNS
eukprot:TRINITY_DN13042_c0_g1_i1.p2 TRINITY_DN13042_c0_g1~~TRINITY_DN13042_c0_g1_i1.p2  ORF type:complete len:100 (+),score=9.37 TRINITY_DN13042_c0_g1_i1:97-396(+)